MKYFITFELHPAGDFGIPEGTKTVIPTGIKSHKGDTFYRKTMTRVSYGTLPLYRKDEDAISLTFNLGSLKAQIKDNFITLEIETESHAEAYDLAIYTLDKFLQHLSLSMKRLYSFKPILFIDEKDKIYLIPKETTMAAVTMYNLSYLRTEIEQTANIFSISDSLLETALEYYEHALFLYESSINLINFTSRHFKYIVSAIFLNHWKAISTIVGDPSTDSDYQSRYRSLGFDYNFFENKIEYVRNIRNNADVAHYTTDKDRLEEIKKQIGIAKEIAETILIAYRASLIR